MNRWGKVMALGWAWLAAWLPASSAAAQAPGFCEITQPATGGVVTGLATLVGTASLPAFDHYDLAFAYSQNPTDTWFPIGDAYRTAVNDGRLAVWDTTGITDGSYDLRLRVWPTSGDPLTAVVHGVRVRNYSAVETGTPAPTPLTPPTSTPALPTPTALPTPFAVTGTSGQTQVGQALSGGALVGLFALALLGGYTISRRAARSGWSWARMRSRVQRQDRPKRRRRRQV
jgi:hypothetical protein